MAACGESFRINVGLIPKEYQDVIADAVLVTQQIFDSEYRAALSGSPPPSTWAATFAAYVGNRGKALKGDDDPTKLANRWSWLWSKGDIMEGTPCSIRSPGDAPRIASKRRRQGDRGDALANTTSGDGMSLAGRMAQSINAFPFEISSANVMSFKGRDAPPTPLTDYGAKGRPSETAIFGT